jgi:hypothetical protein
MAIGMKIASKFDDKGIKQAGKAIGNFGSGLKKVAGLLVAAFAVNQLKDFAVEAVKGAEAARQANDRLYAIAQSMNLFGAETASVTDRLKEFADANEINLGVDADVIKATQAKLLTFAELGKTADETGGAFDRATLAALDLAAAGFGTAETNAIQLGKALQDPIKGISALSRSGVTFTDEQKNMIRAMVEANDILGAQDLVLKAIEQQVGGTAEETATSSEKMELAFNRLKDSVGDALLPVFDDLTAVLIPLIDEIAPDLQKFFEAMSPYIGDAVEAFGELAKDALPVVTEALEKGAQAFEDIQEFLAPLGEEGGALEGFQNIIAGLEEPLGEVVGFLTTLGTTVLSQINDIISSPEFQEAAIAMGENFGGIATQLDRLLQQEITQWLIDLTAPAVVNGMDFFNFQLERMETVLLNINDLLSGTDVEIFEKLRRVFVILGDPFSAGIVEDFIGSRINKEENFRIPALADGGIVRSRPGGTLAIIGEGGQDEAVIPLGRGGMMGNNINVTINAGVGSDPVAIGRYVTDAIKRYENVSGKVFARA